MTDIKSKVQGIDPSAKPRNIKQVIGDADNVYEAISVMEKRAKQLSQQIKEELHNKLDEFAVSTDTIEEIHENKEQIEISKFYERMPNPAVIATEEFISEDLEFRYKNELPQGDDDNQSEDAE